MKYGLQHWDDLFMALVHTFVFFECFFFISIDFVGS